MIANPRAGGRQQYLGEVHQIQLSVHLLAKDIAPITSMVANILYDAKAKRAPTSSIHTE